MHLQNNKWVAEQKCYFADAQKTWSSLKEFYFQENIVYDENYKRVI